jgi:hypothetical protein
LLDFLIFFKHPFQLGLTAWLLHERGPTGSGLLARDGAGKIFVFLVLKDGLKVGPASGEIDFSKLFIKETTEPRGGIFIFRDFNGILSGSRFFESGYLDFRASNLRGLISKTLKNILLNFIIENIDKSLVKLIGLGEGSFHALDFPGSDQVDLDELVDSLLVGCGETGFKLLESGDLLCKVLG